jgi:hypothetical protein
MTEQNRNRGTRKKCKFFLIHGHRRLALTPTRPRGMRDARHLTGNRVRDGRVHRQCVVIIVDVVIVVALCTSGVACPVADSVGDTSPGLGWTRRQSAEEIELECASDLRLSSRQAPSPLHSGAIVEGSYFHSDSTRRAWKTAALEIENIRMCVRAETTGDRTRGVATRDRRARKMAALEIENMRMCVHAETTGDHTAKTALVALWRMSRDR